MKFMKKVNGVFHASESTARLSLLKEHSIKTILFFTAVFAVIVVSFILLFLVRDGYPVFTDVGMINFLLGPSWAPTAAEPLYGIWPLIVGTLLVTLGAMVFAVPLSLGCAIYISELASPPDQSDPQAGCGTAGRDPLGGVRVLRSHRPHELYPGELRYPHRGDLACSLGPARHHGPAHDHQCIRRCHQFRASRVQRRVARHRGNPVADYQQGPLSPRRFQELLPQ